MRWTHVVSLATLASSSEPLFIISMNRFAKGFGPCEGRLPFKLKVVYDGVWERILESKRQDIVG